MNARNTTCCSPANRTVCLCATTRDEVGEICIYCLALQFKTSSSRQLLNGGSVGRGVKGTIFGTKGVKAMIGKEWIRFGEVEWNVVTSLEQIGVACGPT